MLSMSLGQLMARQMATTPKIFRHTSKASSTGAPFVGSTYRVDWMA